MPAPSQPSKSSGRNNPASQPSKSPAASGRTPSGRQPQLAGQREWKQKDPKSFSASELAQRKKGILAGVATAPKGWDPAPEYRDYADVPWFRKRWLLVVSWLLFYPAFVIIVLSGDCYACVDGQVVKYKKTNLVIMAVAAIVLMTLGVFKVVAGK